MSSGNSIDYKLRPNKAVDRELFLSLLNKLEAIKELQDYQYISLGGPFLEDFRMVHARTGISNMVCIEEHEMTYKRQLFNRPLESIICKCSKLDDYLNETEIKHPVIIWFDYTSPGSLYEQIKTFCTQVQQLPLFSILKITLNANSSSLGTLPITEIEPHIPGQEKKGMSLQEWRLERYRERMKKFFPENLTASDMENKYFPNSVLKSLQLGIDSVLLESRDREIRWMLSNIYSDGTQMVTCVLMIVDTGNTLVDDTVKKWSYFSTPSNPHILDLPTLSTIERITMERYEKPNDIMKYDLPMSDLKEDPVVTFKKFYRVFPHYAKVEL